MIKLQAGNAAIESMPGEGTTVTLCFPSERTIHSTQFSLDTQRAQANL